MHPGEETDDVATLPVGLVAMWHEPPILDVFGLLPEERWAAMRWDASTPFPIGLNGPNGSPLLGVLQTPPSHPSRGTSPNDTGGKGSYEPPYRGR